MSRGKKTMNLAYNRQFQEYTVTKLVNSTKPELGKTLTEREVNTYCLGDKWTVTVTGNGK
jgi:hypothetical protein